MKGQKLLNNTLKINALFSMLSGIDFIIFDKSIAGILSEKDLGSLMATGISLIVFSIFVFAISMMKNVNKWLVGVIIAMDSMWVIGSIFLIATGAAVFTTIGLILIGVIAFIIALFAFFQTLGLTRHLKTQTAIIALICLIFFGSVMAQNTTKPKTLAVTNQLTPGTV